VSELPKGWIATEIGDISRIETGSTPPKRNAELYRREICFFKPGDLDAGGTIFESEDMVSKAGAEAGRLLPADSLLITCIGNLGKSALISAPAICNQQINAILPTPAAYPRYLYYWSRTIRPWLEENSSATTVAIINKGRFSKAPINLAPLPEQRRIVSKIDSLTHKSKRARDHLDHIPRLVEKYKQAVLSAAFRGDLTRGWRKTSRVSSEWITTTLDEVVVIASGQTPKGIENRLSADGKFPWFKVSSMNEPDNLHGLRTSQFRLSQQDARDLGLRVIKAGSVAFPKRGGAIATNKKRKLLVDGALDLNLMVLTATGISPEFLWWWMQKLDLVSISNGSNVPQINNGDIARLPINVPSQQEQAQIAKLAESAFTWVDHLAANATSARKLIDHLDQAILAKAFRGELVPQDPSDEPASVLLEHIRSEHAVAPKPQRRRKHQA
jgi:type I restriction enzyme S subunit